jgi:hypothetical protein
MKLPGCRRDVEINMWGGTSSRDKLTGDFGDGREAISIGVCDLFCRLVGKVVACILGLLQQNRPIADIRCASRRPDKYARTPVLRRAIICGDPLRVTPAGGAGGDQYSKAEIYVGARRRCSMAARSPRAAD